MEINRKVLKRYFIMDSYVEDFDLCGFFWLIFVVCDIVYLILGVVFVSSDFLDGFVELCLGCVVCFVIFYV